ncbi:PGF-pre-PGF domain-containing protein [Candidatus Woesearchaeota archaeon]|nr:PGF-pre-PGF domain-containing protein [Candidatus Woesearchaeota archaeon]
MRADAIRIILIAAVLLLALPQAAAADITVCASGCNSTSLSDALIAANGTAHTVIIAEDGTYTIALGAVQIADPDSDGALVLAADGITVDCAGATLSGPGEGTGIRFDYADGCTVLRCAVTGYAHAVSLMDAEDARLSYCSLSGGTDDLLIDGDHTLVYIRNSTVDRSAVDLRDGLLYQTWDVAVSTAYGESPLSGTTVSVTSQSLGAVYSGTTDAGGETEQFEATQYQLLPGGLTNYSLHTITAQKTGYNTTALQTAIVAGGTIPLSITDTTMPAISGLSPANGSTLPEGTRTQGLSFTTNEEAACRMSAAGPAFDFSSGTALNTSDSLSHAATLVGLADGASYTYYYRCNDSRGNINPTGVRHAFSVAADTTVPQASFITPTPADSSTITLTSLQVAISAGEPVSATVTFDGQTATMQNGSNGTIGTQLSKTFSGLADGSHTFSVRATDLAGNKRDLAERTMTVDTMPPALSLVSPANGTVLAEGAGVSLRISTDEAASCTYTGSSSGSLTATSGKSHQTTFAADLSDGDYAYTVTCLDPYSHSEQLYVAFSVVDTTAPVPTFVAPTPPDREVVNSTTVVINFTTNEALGATPIINLDGTNHTCTAGSDYYYYTVSSPSETNYDYWIYLEDATGNNRTTSERSFMVDRTAPEIEVHAPDDDDTLDDSNLVYINVSTVSGSECGFLLLRDDETLCEDGCEGDRDACRDEADDSDERAECDDEFDACEDDCAREGWREIEEDELEETTELSCDDCLEGCRGDCLADRDDCDTDCTTDRCEDACVRTYHDCTYECVAECEEDCISYYAGEVGETFLDADYSLGIVCIDKAGNKAVENVTFTIEDTTPPTITSYDPSGIVYADHLTLTVRTSEDASCRLSESARKNYSEMTSHLVGDGWDHTYPFRGLKDGNHTRYVACNDTKGNVGVPAPVWFEVLDAVRFEAAGRRLLAGRESVFSIAQDDLPVVRITIYTANNYYGVDLGVYKADPTASARLDRTVYSYLDIRLNPSGVNLTNVTVDFKVPLSWLEENRIEPAGVRLYRHGPSWETLLTEHLSSTAGFAYYRAVSPGFSYFAIAGIESLPPPPPARNETDTDPPPKKETPPPEPEAEPEPEEPTQEQEGTPIWLYLVGGLVLFSIFGAAAYFVFHRPGGLEGPKDGAKRSSMPSLPSDLPLPDPALRPLPDDLMSLRDYLAGLREHGLIKSEIMARLSAEGWHPYDIEAVFLQVNESEEDRKLKGIIARSKEKGTGRDEIKGILVGEGFDDVECEVLLDEIYGLPEELISYVAALREAGASPDAVREQLVQAGWSLLQSSLAVSSGERDERTSAPNPAS